MQDYKRMPQLPQGVDLQSSLLTPGGATGENWVVIDGEEIRKRPGLRPVVPTLTADALPSTSYDIPLVAPRGVIAAAQYVVGNQLRSKSFEKMAPRAGSGLTDYLYIYNDTQLVTIQDGRPVVIRKIPVLRINAANSSYRFGVNSTTGLLEFSIRNYSTEAIATVTVTSATTLADVANAVTATAECYVVDTLYSPPPLTQLPSMSGLLASSLVKTSGGAWLNLDQYYSYIYAYVPIEMPLSQPLVATEPNPWAGTLTTPPMFRSFYTQDIAGQDGNVMGVQFQDELLFAGRGDALMSFDGYRLSVAGCNVIADVAPVASAGGSLAAGQYVYRIRCKTVKPSGQITYGPPVDHSIVVALNNKVTLTFPDFVTPDPTVVEYDIIGSNYSDIAASPRRINKMTDASLSGISQWSLTYAQAALVKPQVGEYIGDGGLFSAALLSGGHKLITSIQDIGTGIELTVDGGFDTPGADISMGEYVEIFRTAIASPTFFYLLKTLPMRSASYVDLAVDDISANPVYVAKPYVIQQPPDCCAAVAVHQNRIVVVGEYLASYKSSRIYSPRLTTNRPFMKNVYWGQPNNEEFNPLNNVILDVTEGGELNSAYSTGNALYVGGQNSLWLIQGNLSSASLFTVNKISGAGGTVGNTAITAINGQIFAVSRAGLYALSGSSADYSVGEPVNSLIRALPEDQLKYIRLFPFKNTGLAVILPGMTIERPAAQITANNETFPSSYMATERAEDSTVLVYDPNTKKWSTWTGHEMYLGGGLVNFDGLTWAFPRKDGKPICVLDSGYGMDGFSTAVEMSLKGPWQTDEDLFTDKNFSRLRIISASPSSQNFVLTTKIERNWNENEPVQTASVGFRSGTGYAQSAYATQPYGDGNEMAQQVPLTNQKALSVRAVFENSNPAEFPSITGWNFEVGENRKNMKQE